MTDGDGDVPLSEDRYAPGRVIRAPRLVMLFGSLALAALAAGGFGWVLWLRHGPWIGAQLAGPGGRWLTWAVRGGVLLAGAALFTAIVHEGIHVVAYRAYGHAVTVSCDLRRAVLYTSVPDQLQRRSTVLVVSSSPFLALPAIMLPFLLLPWPEVALFAYLVILINSAGSVGDLYVVYRLSRLPPGTMLYDVDVDRVVAFEPVERTGV